MSFRLTAVGGAHGLDRIETLRALTLLMDRGQAFELRSLPSGRSRICHGQDLPAAIEAAWELSDEAGLYFTLNPLPHDQDRPGRDREILQRRWILIDVDPIRVDHSQSSTESEKIAAFEVAGNVRSYLSDTLGWPEPLGVDSGNGWHLLYRVDLPNDKLAQQLVKAILVRLAGMFDTPAVKVDRAVHNAARISKLPGSWARKGLDTPERPHRLSRIVYEPESLVVVTVEQLDALVRKDEPSPSLNGSTHSPFTKRATNGKGLEAYCKSAVERECGRLCMTPEGNRDNQINASAFSLGTMAAWPEMDSPWAKQALYRAGQQCGLDDASISRAINSGWTAGAAEPRPRPVDPQANGKANPLPPGTSPIVWGNTIKRRKVDWLVPRRIPLGKLTTFAGQTGMGKTYTVCDTAARVTRGMEIPFSGGLCFEQGSVLIISAEDDADDTLLPRIIDAGGDDRKIAFLSPEAEENFSLAALELLNASLDDMGPDVRFIAIDPPTSYLGKTDDHKNAELRGLLGPLKRFCRQRNVALIFVTHVNKSAQSVDALQRVMGSVAWVAAVRAAHMFCQDPEAPGKSLYVPLKVNNARKPKALRYVIEGPEDEGVLRWLEEVDTTADEAVGATKKKSRGVCAVEWLTERFLEKYEWESEEITRAGKEAGFSRNALWSPEVLALPFKKRKRVNADGVVCWMWTANPGWPSPAKNDGTVETVGTIET